DPHLALRERETEAIGLAVPDFEIDADLLVSDRRPVRVPVVLLGAVVDETLPDRHVGGGQERELLLLVVFDGRAPGERVEVVLEEALRGELPRRVRPRRRGGQLERPAETAGLVGAVDVTRDELQSGVAVVPGRPAATSRRASNPGRQRRS